MHAKSNKLYPFDPSCDKPGFELFKNIFVLSISVVLFASPQRIFQSTFPYSDVRKTTIEGFVAPTKVFILGSFADKMRAVNRLSGQGFEHCFAVFA